MRRVEKPYRRDISLIICTLGNMLIILYHNTITVNNYFLTHSYWLAQEAGGCHLSPAQHIAQVTVQDQYNLLVAEIFSNNLSSFNDLVSVSASERWS